MKKILLLAVCLMMIGMQSVKAQRAVVALHHLGTVKTYESFDLDKAFENSVDGDTIYFSNGLFGGNYSISQKITLIGSGTDTYMLGNVSVEIPDSAELSNTLFSNLKINSVSFNLPINNSRISQCVIRNLSFNAGIGSVVIERCFLETLTLSANLGCIEIFSSKIDKLTGYSKDIDKTILTNCNIRLIDNFPNNGCNATLFNSIFTNYTGTNGEWGNMKYYNCLTNYSGGCTWNESYKENCYWDGSFVLDDDLNCSMSDDQLKNAGYLGIDGTVVGVTGGEVPFTLVSPGLQVTEHNLEVDNVERKLKVSLKLGNK